MPPFVERFPRPEFDSGHSLPLVEAADIRAPWMDGVDAVVLLLALLIATRLTHQQRARRGLGWLALASVAYFGFIRQGCICPVGSLQNLALSLFNSGYVLPLAVAAFFLAPLVFALLVGRTFCGSVCPLGAIQEIVLLNPVRVPPWLDRPLRLLAWVYLGAALLFAATESGFVICRYDPFVSFFRLDGSTDRLLLGLGFLLAATVVARPYCRWLCPYGVLLGLASHLSVRPVKITSGECTRCNQCVDACPLDAIRPAGPRRSPAATRPLPRLRIALIAALLPLAAAGWWIGDSLSPRLSRAHPAVAMAEQVHLDETGQIAESTDAVDGFWRTGDAPPELFAEAATVKGTFSVWTPVLGAILALLLGIHLLRWTGGRELATCEADRGDCMACGRCFDACPENGEREATTVDPARRRAALAMACAGAVLVVALTIPMTLAPLGEASPIADGRLDERKAELLADRDNTALQDEIRDLDLQLRQRWLTRRDRSRLGRYLLLLGAVLLIGGARLARPLPAPPTPPALRVTDRWLADNRRARSAVGVAAVLLVAAFAAWSAIPAGEIGGATFSATMADLAHGTDPAEPTSVDSRTSWPRFRGPRGAGVAAEGTYPTAWDVPSGEGVLWTADLSLPGKGSPIVAEGRVVVTGADETRREVQAFDARTGAPLWKSAVDAEYRPNPEDHWTMNQTGHAAPTPATDGQNVYAIFSNGDVTAVRLTGEPSWTINLGAPDSAYGYASSLVAEGGRLLVQYDQGLASEGRSELLALDTATGRFAWRAKRPVEGSWSTPITFVHDARPQVVTAANPWIMAHDPADGEELWRVGGLRGDGAASPVYTSGLVLVITPGERVTAIRPDGTGDVTDSHVAWTAEGPFPDLCSPVSDGERIWLLTRDGQLTCLSSSGGQQLWATKLEGRYSASPSLADGHLYCLNQAGTMFLLGAGDSPVILGRAELGDKAWASPAFVDGRIYLRGENRLVCVGPR